MDLELKSAIDEFRGTLQNLRTDLDHTKKEHKDLSETQEKVTKFSKKLDELEDRIVSKQQLEDTMRKAQEDFGKQMEQLEATMKRAGNAFSDAAKKNEPSELMKAFDRAVRQVHGKMDISKHNGYSDDVVKAFTISNDPAAGYLAPLEMVQMLVDVNMVQLSPIRPLCSSRITSQRGVTMPVIERHGAATWVEETGTRSEIQGPTFGVREIVTGEQSANALVSRQDLEDSVINIEAILRQEWATQFGLAENVAFLNGDGIGKPLGMLVDPRVGTFNLGSNTTLTADGLINMTFELKDPYMQGASWVMARRTLAAVRTLKDGDGRYIWTSGFDNRLEPTLCGFPYTRAEAMPAIAASAKPVLFGNFKMGYVIVDRLQMAIMADPFSKKNQGLVEYQARKRVGGYAICPEALLIGVIAA